jgi:hypothetical protein
MKIATGTVVDGRIVVDGKPFSDGEKVTVLGGQTSTFSVSDEEKRMLLKSIAQADRGEFADMDDLLSELDDSN